MLFIFVLFGGGVLQKRCRSRFVSYIRCGSLLCFMVGRLVKKRGFFGFRGLGTGISVQTVLPLNRMLTCRFQKSLEGSEVLVNPTLHPSKP